MTRRETKLLLIGIGIGILIGVVGMRLSGSRTGRYQAVTSESGTVKIVDTRTGKVTRSKSSRPYQGMVSEVKP